MKWKGIITEAFLEVSESKSNHELAMSDIYTFIERNGYQNNFDSEDWRATARRTVYGILEEVNPILVKISDDTYKLNVTSQDEITEKLVEFSEENGGAPIGRSEAIELLIEKDSLKPADFLSRPSRNNEFWFKQNVGNAMRDSNVRSKKFNAVFGSVDGMKTISAAMSGAEVRAIKEHRKLPKKVVRETSTWMRDAEIAKQAKVICEYKCELGCDMAIRSFKNKDGNNYTHAHHIIPMGAQGAYQENIDVISNLIVLCPYHHSAIHNGDISIRLEILEKVFEVKKSNSFFVSREYSEIERFYK